MRNLEFIDPIFTLEWLSNEVLLYSTGNYIQSSEIDYNGRLYEKKGRYVCMTGSLFYTQ